jgi:hypothetical protein
MARQTKEELDATPVVVAVPPEDADVVRILTELGASGKYISLKRQNLSSKEFDYVGKYDLAEFHDMSLFLERVKEDHGGGKYQGRIYGEKDGETKYLKYVTFSIDPRFRPAVVPPPMIPGAGTPPSELSEIKNALAVLAQAITSMMQKPQHDPLDIGLRIAEAMRGGQKEALPVSSSPSITEAFTILKQGIDMGKELSGGGGDLGYLPVIEKLGAPLIEAFGKMASRPNPVVEKVNGGKPLPRPTPSTPEQYLQAYLPQILGLAAEKKNPALYAELVLDRAPETQYDFLYGVATRPDVIAYLSSLHPGVKEHEAWFLEFVSAIKEELEPEPTTEQPEISVPDIQDDPQHLEE